VHPESPWMTPAEFALALNVDERTVSRWAKSGRLDGRVRVVRTPGGHRRYNRADTAAYLQGGESR